MTIVIFTCENANCMCFFKGTHAENSYNESFTTLSFMTSQMGLQRLGHFSLSQDFFFVFMSRNGKDLQNIFPKDLSVSHFFKYSHRKTSTTHKNRSFQSIPFSLSSSSTQTICTKCLNELFSVSQHLKITPQDKRVVRQTS